MVAKALNTLGLMLNITGVIILFFFAYPQPTHEEGGAILAEDNTPIPGGGGRTFADERKDLPIGKATYLFWSQSGLMLIIVGFVFQLIGTWCDEKSEWL